MKRSNFTKQSAVFYIGKGLIIGALILTASLSFLLGFLVGNRTAKTPKDTHLMERTPEKEPDHTLQEAARGDPQQQLETQMSAREQAPPLVQNQPPSASQTIVASADVTPPDKRSDQNLSPAVAPKREPPNAASADAEKKNSRGEQNTVRTPSNVPTKKYTVQVGAFKNPAEADVLKTSMIKKGYNVFIVSAKTKQQETLYKVMVGEYRTRREAEVQSIKLKNAEGVRTFVTFVMQEGAIRQQ